MGSLTNHQHHKGAVDYVYALGGCLSIISQKLLEKAFSNDIYMLSFPDPQETLTDKKKLVRREPTLEETNVDTAPGGHRQT